MPNAPSAPGPKRRPPGRAGPPPELVSLEVTLKVIRGRNLAAMDKDLITRKYSSSDPFVAVYLFGRKKHGKTRTISKTLDPRWDESFSIRFGSKYANRIARSEPGDAFRTVELRVFDRKKCPLTKSEAMGVVYIPIHPINNAPSTRWYKAQTGRKGSEHYCEKASGEIEVRVTTKVVRAAAAESVARAPVTTRRRQQQRRGATPPNRIANANRGGGAAARSAGIKRGSSEETETSSVASTENNVNGFTINNSDAGAASAAVEPERGDSSSEPGNRNDAKPSRPRLQRQSQSIIGDALSDVPHASLLLRRRRREGPASKESRLTEATAQYERATKKYTAALADDKTTPDEQGRVLNQIYTEFEATQTGLFAAYREEGSASGGQGTEEGDDGQQASSTPLRKVLIAATRLLDDIEFFHDEGQKNLVFFVLLPRFVSDSTVDAAWIAAVVSVVAREISRATGRFARERGASEELLPAMTMTTTELLDLIAWVDNFRGIMDKINAAVMCGSRLRALEKGMAEVDLEHEDATGGVQPRLFRAKTGDSEAMAVMTRQDALDGLVWAYAALMDLHEVTQDELIVRTREQTSEWASEAYKIENNAWYRASETSSGRVFTSLPEDVFTPLSVQLKTICDRLSLSSEVLPALFGVVLSTIRTVHIREGGKRLTDLEHRCAAANDFERMGEQWGGIVADILEECSRQVGGEEDKSEKRRRMKRKLEAVASEVVHTFTTDAVHAARSVVLPIFEPIRTAVEPELFYPSWEERYTQNELAKILTVTLEDFDNDLEGFLGEFLLEKARSALVSASVVFYIECLLKKARKDDTEEAKFGDNAHALQQQMKGDIYAMHAYFESLAEEMPHLKRKVAVQLDILVAFHGILSEAAGLSDKVSTGFIVLLHKRIRDVDVTTNVILDLWNLVAPEAHRKIKDVLPARIEKLLSGVEVGTAPPLDGSQTMVQIPGLRLDEMAAEVCGTRRDASRCAFHDAFQERLNLAKEKKATEKSSMEALQDSLSSFFH